MICRTTVLLLLLTAIVNSQSTVSVSDAVNTEDLSVPAACDADVETLDTCLTGVYDNNPLKQCFLEQSCLPDCCNKFTLDGVQHPAGYTAELLSSLWSSICSEGAGLSSNLSFHLINDFVVNEIATTALFEQNDLEKGCDHSELISAQLAPTLTDISQWRPPDSLNETARVELCLAQNPTSLQQMVAGFRTCIQNFPSTCVNRYLATAKALYDQTCPASAQASCQFKSGVKINIRGKTCPLGEFATEFGSLLKRFTVTGCPRIFHNVAEVLLGTEDLVWDPAVVESCDVRCEESIDNFGACVDANADLSSHKKGKLEGLLEGTSTTFQFLVLRHREECRKSGESQDKSSSGDSDSSGSHSGESFAELEETIQSQCLEPLKETGCFPEFVTQKFREEGCQYLLENEKLDRKAKDVKAFCDGTKCGKKSGSKSGKKSGSSKSGGSGGKKGDGNDTD